MAETLSFFIVLAAGLVLSEIFHKLHLPWVIALIAAGLIIGPNGFSILESTPTLQFLAEIGLVFLMFMAGLETRLSSFKDNRRGVAMVTIFNGLIPFLVALQIGLFFDYNLTTSLLLGAVFISSSIAVIIPSLTRNNLLRTKLGKTILGSTVIEDILSLILLSVLLQTSLTVTRIPLPLFYILVLVSLFALRWLVPQVQKKFHFNILGFFQKRQQQVDLFQQNLRLVITILIGTVLVFEVLGLHPIIAGFFAGLILSESITSEKLHEKLRVISYGIFIPIFFVHVGIETNLSSLIHAKSALLLVSVIAILSLLSKLVGGFLGGLFSGFNAKQSILIGVATMPQLTTTLAVAFAGSKFGLFDERLVASLVVLSLVSTLISPLLMRPIIKRLGTA